MAPASTTSNGIAAVVVAATTLLVSGCGLSSITSGIGGGMFGGSSSSGQPKGVTEEQMLSAAKAEGTDAGSTVGEVAYGCPRFIVWPRDHTLTIYEPGRVGDGLAVMHRGEITKTARECQIEPGRVTVKYGFSGRVLMGPRGQPGPVQLPVAVFVTDAKRERLTADRITVQTDIAADRPIGYFSIVRSVSFQIPEGTRPGEFEVFVGFERKVPNAG
jgi:hypothetical protein